MGSPEQDGHPQPRQGLPSDMKVQGAHRALMTADSIGIRAAGQKRFVCRTARIPETLCYCSLSTGGFVKG